MPASIDRPRHPVFRAAFLIAALLIGALPAWAQAPAPLPATPLPTVPLAVRISDRGPLRDYAREVLKLALDRSGRAYEIEMVRTEATVPRLMRLLESGPDAAITVHWAATEPEFEERLLPVRIPIDRGLVGYRVLLIRQDEVQRFAGVRTLDDLKGFTLGQGFGWSHVDILRAAGLRVQEIPEFDGLFRMVAAGNLDAVPRGATDIGREIAERAKTEPNLAIEPRLALVYDHAAIFFFVNRQNLALYQAIKDGLETAYADGSFMALFEGHPDIRAGRALAAQDRVLLKIANPALTPATAALDARYFEDVVNRAAQ